MGLFEVGELVLVGGVPFSELVNDLVPFVVLYFPFVLFAFLVLL